MSLVTETGVEQTSRLGKAPCEATHRPGVSELLEVTGFGICVKASFNFHLIITLFANLDRWRTTPQSASRTQLKDRF